MARALAKFSDDFRQNVQMQADQRAAVQAAIQEFQTGKTPNRASISGGNLQNQVSDVYEDNAVQLLVKCIHNGSEFSISSKWRDRNLSKWSLPSKETDFCAEVVPRSRRQRRNLRKVTYPACFRSTKQKTPPTPIDESELSTPPPFPVATSSRSGHAVFEIVRDDSLWRTKLAKLNEYVGELKDVLMAGVVFVTAAKFQAVREHQLDGRRIHFGFGMDCVAKIKHRVCVVDGNFVCLPSAEVDNNVHLLSCEIKLLHA